MEITTTGGNVDHTGDGDIVCSGAGNVDIDAVTGNVTFSGSGDVQTTGGGNVTIDAAVGGAIDQQNAGAWINSENLTNIGQTRVPATVNISGVGITSDGTILVDASGAITIENAAVVTSTDAGADIDIATTGGTLLLQNTASIDADDDLTLQGDVVTLNSDNVGNEVVSGGAVLIDADNGNVNIGTAGATDIVVTGVGGDTVTIRSTTAQVMQNDGQINTNIPVVITGQTGVDCDAASDGISGTTIDITATTGDVELSMDNGPVAATVDVDIAALGAGGDVLYYGDGDITSGAGEIDIDALLTIVMSGAGNIDATGGDVHMDAGTTITQSGTGVIRTNTGTMDVDIDAGTSFSQTGATADIISADDILIGLDDATDDIIIQGLGATAAQVTATGLVNMRANTANDAQGIHVGGGGTTLDVTGASVTLNADADADGHGRLLIEGDSALVSNTGAIVLDGGDDGGSVGVSITALTTAGGGVEVDAATLITITSATGVTLGNAGANDASADLDAAGGGITIDANGGAVLQNQGTIIATGLVDIDATGAITQDADAGGTLGANVDAIQGSAVDIDSAGPGGTITIGADTGAGNNAVEATGGSVEITTTGGNVDHTGDGDIEAAIGNVDIDASVSIVQSGSGDIITTTAGAAGNVILDAATAVTQSGAGALIVSDHDVLIGQNTVPVTIDISGTGVSGITADDLITMDATGAITINDTAVVQTVDDAATGIIDIASDGGQLLLDDQAQIIANADLASANLIMRADSMDLRSDNGTEIQAGGYADLDTDNGSITIGTGPVTTDIVAAGYVLLWADDPDLGQNGDVTQVNLSGGLIQSTGASVSVRADGNIQIDPIHADTFVDINADGNVTITGDVTADNSYIYIRADSNADGSGDVTVSGAGTRIFADDQDMDGDGVIWILGHDVSLSTLGVNPVGGLQADGSDDGSDGTLGDVVPGSEFAIAILAQHNISYDCEIKATTGSIYMYADAPVASLAGHSHVGAALPGLACIGNNGVAPDGSGSIFNLGNGSFVTLGFNTDIIMNAADALNLDGATQAVRHVLVYCAEGITVNAGGGVESERGHIILWADSANDSEGTPFAAGGADGTGNLTMNDDSSIIANRNSLTEGYVELYGASLQVDNVEAHGQNASGQGILMTANDRTADNVLDIDVIGRLETARDGADIVFDMIDAGGAPTYGDITQGAGTMWRSDGTIVFDTAGTQLQAVTLYGSLTTDEAVSITTNNGANGNVTFNTLGTILIGGHFQVTAAGTIAQTGGTVQTDVGNVLYSADTIDLSDGVTYAGTGYIDMAATGAVSGVGNLTANALTAEAGNAGVAIHLDAPNTGTVTMGGTGTATAQANLDVVIDPGVFAFNTDYTASGNITAWATGAGTVADGVTLRSTGGNIQLYADSTALATPHDGTGDFTAGPNSVLQTDDATNGTIAVAGESVQLGTVTAGNTVTITSDYVAAASTGTMTLYGDITSGNGANGVRLLTNGTLNIALADDVAVRALANAATISMNCASLTGDYNLDVSTNNGAVTLDTIGVINSLDVTTGTGVVTLNGSISTDEHVVVDGASGVTLGGDVTVTTTDGTLGNVTFTGDVNGAQSLTINAGNDVAVEDIGDTNRLTAIAIDAGGTVTLNGTTYQTDGGAAATIGIDGDGGIILSTGGFTTTMDTETGGGTDAGAITLGNVTADAAGSDLSLNSSVGDANIAGNLEVGSLGTPVMPLDVVTLNAQTVGGTAGTLTLNGDIWTGTLTTTNVAGAVTLGDDVAITVTVAGVNFSNASAINATTAGIEGLDINAAALAVQLPTVGNLQAVDYLRVTSAGTTTLNGNVRAVNGIDLGNAADVDLAVSVTLTNTDSGTVDLTGGAVDGGNALAIVANATAVALDDLGQNVALASLDVDGTGTTTLTGDITTNNGNVDFSDASNVVLGADVDIDTGPGVGDVDFDGGGVNALSGVFDLDVDAGTGSVEFDDVSALTGLTVDNGAGADGATNVTFNGDVDITGAITVIGSGIADINAELSTISAINVVMGGDVQVDGEVSTSGGSAINLESTGADVEVAFDAAATISSEDGRIELDGANVMLGDVPGNANAARVVTTAGDVKVDAETAFTMNANAATQIDSGGEIDIDPVTATIAGAGLLAVGDIDVTASGAGAGLVSTVTVNGVVESTAGAVTLTATNNAVTADSLVTLNANVIGDGVQVNATDVDGTATDLATIDITSALDNSRGGYDLNATTGVNSTITVGATVDAVDDITADAEDITVSNTVTTATAGVIDLHARDVLDIDAELDSADVIDLDGDTSILLSANLTAANDIDVNDALTLDGDSTIESEQGDVTFDQDVSEDVGGSNRNLRVEAELGEVTFSSTVGAGAEQLLSLTVEAIEAILNDNIFTDGGNVDFQYTEDVTLTNNVTIDTEDGDDANAGDILFGADTWINGGFTLTLNTATAFGGATAGNVRLCVVNTVDTLIVNTSAATDGTTTLLGNITANTLVDFTNAADVDLGANVSILSGDGTTNVDLDGGDVGEDYDLVINNVNGTVNIGADAASVMDVNSLTVTNVGQTNLAGGIAADDGIDLGNATNVDLTAALTLTNTDSGTVDLTGGAVDGGNALAIVANATAVALDDLGQNVALASLDVDGTGTTTLTGDITTNNGNVDFSDASNVVLGADVDIDTGPGVGDVDFDGGGVNALSGVFDLDVDAGTGSVEFDDVSALTGLTVDNGAGADGATNVTFNGDVDITGAITVIGSGIADINAELSTISAINVVMGGDVQVDGEVSTSGGSAINLESTGADVEVAFDAAATISSEDGRIELDGANVMLGDVPGNANAARVVTTAGDVKVDAETAFTMNANAATQIDSGGEIDIDPVTATIDGAGLLAVGNITITASGATGGATSQVDVDGVVQSTGGTVTITATNSDNGSDSQINLNANVIASDVDVVAEDQDGNDDADIAVGGALSNTSGEYDFDADTSITVNDTVEAIGPIDMAADTVIVNDNVESWLADVILTANDGDVDINADVTASDEVEITARDGGGGDADITLDGDLESRNNDVTLRADEDVALNGDISAGVRDVEITADADISGTGAITDSDPVDEGEVIEALEVDLYAAQGIGGPGNAGADDIDINADWVSATNTTSGGIYLDTVGDVEIGAVDEQSGGAISITSSGDMLIDGPITETGAGTISLVSNGAETSITVEAAINAQTGTVDLTASGGVMFDDNGDITTTSGDITVEADSDSDGGVFTQSDGSVISSGSGAIDVDAGGDATVGQLSTGGNVDVTSDSGGIVDSGSSLIDIAGAIVTLGADTHIGTAGNPLEMSATSLNATVNASAADSGGIYITESDGITLTSVTTNGGEDVDDIVITSLGGDITVVTVTAAGLGDVTLVAASGSILDDGADGTVISADFLTLTATGDIGDDTPSADDIDTTVTWLEATSNVAGDIFIDETDALVIAGAGVSTTASDITITSAGDLDINSPVTALSDGAIDIESTGGSVTISAIVSSGPAGGAIEIDANNNVEFGAGGLVSTGDDVDITAGDAVLDDGNTDVDVEADTLVFDVGDGIGEDLDPIETIVATLEADNATSGGIFVSDFEGLEIGAAGVVNHVAGGDVRIECVDEMTVNGPVSVVGAGDLELLSSDGEVTVNDTVTGFTGEVMVEGYDGVTLNDVVSATTGNVEIYAEDGPVTINSLGAGVDVVLTTTGWISIEGEDTVTINGDVTSTSGGINIEAGWNVILNGANGSGYVETGGDVHIEAEGAIYDGTVDATDGAAFITAYYLQMSAEQGIGVDNPATGPVEDDIDTNVNSLNVTNTVSGDIVIDETDAVTITGAETQLDNGNIDVTADGTITVTGVVSANGTGDVDLRAVGAASSIDVDSDVFSGTGDIALNAGDNITVDADVVTAGVGTIALTAGDDMGMAADDVADVTIQSADGGITLTADNLTQGDGTDNRAAIVSARTGDIKLTVAVNYVMNGNVNTVVSTRGNITVDPVNVTINGAGHIANGDVNITASNNILLLGGTITSLDKSVTITADDDDVGGGDFTMAVGTTVVAETTVNISGDNIALEVVMAEDDITVSGEGAVTTNALVESSDGNISIMSDDEDGDDSGDVGDDLTLAAGTDLHGRIVTLSTNAGNWGAIIVNDDPDNTIGSLVIGPATSLQLNDDLTGRDGIDASTLNADTILGANVTISSTDADIDFSSGDIYGVFALTTDSGTAVTTIDSIGQNGANPMAWTGTAAEVILQGNVSVDGNVDLSAADQVSLEANLTINTSGGPGDIDLANDVTVGANDLNGDYDLILTAGSGDVYLDKVGQAPGDSLNSIDVNSSGTTTLYGDIQVDVDAEFSDAVDVDLGADVGIVADTGEVDFGNGGTNQLDGEYALVIDAGTNVWLDEVGQNDELTDLTVIADGTLTLTDADPAADDSITVIDSLDFSDSPDVNIASSIVISTPAGEAPDIDLTGGAVDADVDDTYTLTIDAQAGLVMLDEIGGGVGTQPAELDVSANRVQLYDDINVDGNVTFTTTVNTELMNDGIQIDMGGGSGGDVIDFTGSSIAGNHDLELIAGPGDVELGDVIELSGLTVTSSATTRFNGEVNIIGSVAVTASALIDQDAEVSADGDLLYVTTIPGDIDIDADLDVQGNVTINAGNAGTDDGSNIDILATSVEVGGNLGIQGDDVTVNLTTLIVDGASAMDADSDLDVDIGTVWIGGNASWSGTDSVDIGFVTYYVGGAETITGPAIAITADSLTVDGDWTLHALTGDLDVTVTNQIVVGGYGDLDADNADVNLSAGNMEIGSYLDIDADVNVDFDVADDLEVGGDLSVNAGTLADLDWGASDISEDVIIGAPVVELDVVGVFGVSGYVDVDASDTATINLATAEVGGYVDIDSVNLLAFAVSVGGDVDGDFDLASSADSVEADIETLTVGGDASMIADVDVDLDIANVLTVLGDLLIQADDDVDVDGDITLNGLSSADILADFDTSGAGNLTIAGTDDSAIALQDGLLTLQGENIALGSAGWSAVITGTGIGQVKITANANGDAATGNFVLQGPNSVINAGGWIDIDDPYDVSIGGVGMIAVGPIWVVALHDIDVLSPVISSSAWVEMTADTDDNGGTLTVDNWVQGAYILLDAGDNNGAIVVTADPENILGDIIIGLAGSMTLSVDLTADGSVDASAMTNDTTTITTDVTVRSHTDYITFGGDISGDVANTHTLTFDAARDVTLDDIGLNNSVLALVVATSRATTLNGSVRAGDGVGGVAVEVWATETVTFYDDIIAYADVVLQAGFEIFQEGGNVETVGGDVWIDADISFVQNGGSLGNAGAPIDGDLTIGSLAAMDWITIQGSGIYVNGDVEMTALAAPNDLLVDADVFGQARVAILATVGNVRQDGGNIWSDGDVVIDAGSSIIQTGGTIGTAGQPVAGDVLLGVGGFLTPWSAGFTDYPETIGLDGGIYSEGTVLAVAERWVTVDADIFGEIMVALGSHGNNGWFLQTDGNIWSDGDVDIFGELHVTQSGGTIGTIVDPVGGDVTIGSGPFGLEPPEAVTIFGGVVAEGDVSVTSTGNGSGLFGFDGVAIVGPGVLASSINFGDVTIVGDYDSDERGNVLISDGAEVSAATGDVTVSGQDISVLDSGATMVFAGAALTFSANQDILLDAGTSVGATGDVTATAGRNFTTGAELWSTVGDIDLEATTGIFLQMSGDILAYGGNLDVDAVFIVQSAGTIGGAAPIGGHAYFGESIMPVNVLLTDLVRAEGDIRFKVRRNMRLRSARIISVNGNIGIVVDEDNLHGGMFFGGGTSAIIAHNGDILIRIPWRNTYFVGEIEANNEEIELRFFGKDKVRFFAEKAFMRDIPVLGPVLFEDLTKFYPDMGQVSYEPVEFPEETPVRDE